MNDYRRDRKHRKRTPVNRVEIGSAVNTVFARDVGTINHVAGMTPAAEFEAAERSESKGSTMAFKLTDSQAEIIRRTAREIGISPSDLCRDALELFLAFYPDIHGILRDADRVLAIYRMMKR